MNHDITVAVFGATGKLGKLFVDQALEKGYTLRLLVRNRAKVTVADNPKVEVIEGNATNIDDVRILIKGADVVVSCLGNVNKQLIMENSFDNILAVATEQTSIPRCLMLTTVGCGGTSWLIKGILSLIGGKKGFEDYEKADKRVREEQRVPYMLVRPYALTNNEGLEKYKVIQAKKQHFMKSIARADVAKFLVDCVKDTQWDNKDTILLGGAK